MVTAGYGRRFIAICIDWAIATFSAALIIPLQSSSLGPSLTRLGVFVLEVAVLTSLGGASAGQRIMKLRVLSFPDHLFVRPVPIFVRTFLIALVIPAVVTDRDGRGLHDRVAKTVVMRLR
ncbi:MAG: RDD family protein [Actinomycetota bacterium]|jgi:uncharacterized RDD family membrane protein YckC